MFSVADWFPANQGKKVTERLQLAPAAIVEAQEFTS
jgi:hypothetical protein